MRQVRILLALLLALLLGACAAQEAVPQSAPEPIPTLTPGPVPTEPPSLRIVVASDWHYLSQALTDNGSLFRRIVEHGDGKLMLDIEAISEAFIEQMLDERPDAIVLTGDLSFNGEYQSLADLAGKLSRLPEAGIPVLVLPGNHDIRRSGSYRYADESREPVPNTSAEEFRALFEAFGRQQARSVDEVSGSYVWEAAAGLRLLVLDTNSASGNLFPTESLDWLARELRDAEEAGAQVISFSHQNLLVHNPMFTFGYQISNADAIAKLLAQYGVLANLSGHMHIQHYLDGPVPEILSSPLSLVPCRYGLLVWDGAGLTYETRSVDVSAWAQRHGCTEEHLLNFETYAAESFYQIYYNQIAEGLAGRELPEDAPERMARCFAEVNLAYFTGEPVDRERLAEELDFWVSVLGESFETAYLRGILEDDAPSPLRVTMR